jgi:hypothetical protein
MEKGSKINKERGCTVTTSRKKKKDSEDFLLFEI